MANNNDTIYMYNCDHCLSDIYGQSLVVHTSKCIHLHCCFNLQQDKEKRKKKSNRISNVYNDSMRNFKFFISNILIRNTVFLNRIEKLIKD